MRIRDLDEEVKILRKAAAAVEAVVPQKTGAAWSPRSALTGSESGGPVTRWGSHGRGTTAGLLMRRAALADLPACPLARQADPKLTTITDLVRSDGPDQLRVTGITEHLAREGKVYYCLVLDAWSRRVAGWAIDSAQRADPATSALGMAIESRSPAAGGVIHGDHGTQGGFNWWRQRWLAEAVSAR